MTQTEMRFDGKSFDPKLDGKRLTGQMLRDWAVLKVGDWLTDEEIAVISGDPVVSVGSRRRDLRKERFGAWTVESRRRGDPSLGIWEHRLVLK